jgi:hypothetical protein
LAPLFIAWRKKRTGGISFVVFALALTTNFITARNHDIYGISRAGDYGVALLTGGILV